MLAPLAVAKGGPAERRAVDGREALSCGDAMRAVAGMALLTFVVLSEASRGRRRRGRHHGASPKSPPATCAAPAISNCSLLEHAVGGACRARLVADEALCRGLRSVASDADAYFAAGTPIAEIARPVVLSAGYGHTGTHAVAAYLDELGFDVLHNMPGPLLDAIRCRDFSKLAKKFDAFLDDPMGVLWPVLARVFPNHRLVLTYRNDYKRQYAQDDERCVARRSKKADDFVLAHLASSCAMFGVACASDKAWTAALQDANVESVRAYARATRGEKKRVALFDIKAGELNFTTVRAFVGDFGAAKAYTGKGPHHPDYPFDHKVDHVGFSRGARSSPAR